MSLYQFAECLWVLIVSEGFHRAITLINLGRAKGRDRIIGVVVLGHAVTEKLFVGPKVLRGGVGPKQRP